MSPVKKKEESTEEVTAVPTTATVVVAKKPRAPRRKKSDTESVTAQTEATSVEPTLTDVAKPEGKDRSYLEAVGRRKRAVARVRIWRGGKPSIIINKRTLEQFFPLEHYQSAVTAPLKAVGQMDRLEITVVTKGGGAAGQSVAIRHGISRALLLLNPVFRRALKKLGYLTRDPREKERKKPGLKRARRAPQWQKR